MKIGFFAPLLSYAFIMVSCPRQNLIPIFCSVLSTVQPFGKVTHSQTRAHTLTCSPVTTFHLCRKDTTTFRFTFNFSSSGFLIEPLNISLFTDMQRSIYKDFKKRQTCPFMNSSGIITILKGNRKKKILRD